MTQFPAFRAASRIALVALLAVTAACGSLKDEEMKGTAEKLYADAKEEMASGNWTAAIKGLERVEGRAGGGLLGQQSQLDLAYSYWKSGEKAQAITTLDRFIKLNPSSPGLDYALYLRGLVNFNEDFGILAALSQQQQSERDQQASRESYQSFKQLVDQFPDSKYSPDARARMDYIVNALADYEVHVARYYLRRGALVAAANRAQQAITVYPQTPATEEALYILGQAYDRLGLDKLRDDANRVLALNFPNSRLPQEGFKEREKAWWQLW
ncbi:MAG TPA: outer membrane protein assembly factor BamD [Ideonella sp.]|uniref:outer membrane protein assembly factor BamD n=1 Tax=Ideonella sp. TaxID=1929293 RepID=UPI002C3E9580|nr:outer membrane protein assembly factor BamD [Ideonella sp.]HSI46858.1 outer membrane protein assembly factor BamD [Ideonella sp.]